MGGTSTSFFIIVVGLLIAFSVWFNFWLILLVVFAGIMIVTTWLLFKAWDHEESRRLDRSSTSNPFPRESNLRVRIEDEWYSQPFGGGPADLR